MRWIYFIVYFLEALLLAQVISEPSQFLFSPYYAKSKASPVLFQQLSKGILKNSAFAENF